MIEHDKKNHPETEAVIYTRSASCTLGLIDKRQVDACRNYAVASGYRVTGTFHDTGVSGCTAQRDGMNDMLSYLRANQTRQHVVIVEDLSRLARDTQVYLELRSAIESCGATLKSLCTTRQRGAA